MNWWIAKANNEVHSTLLQCLPSVVCWDIWKSRCAAMFENKKMSAWHIIQQVSNLMTLIINYQFPTLQLPQLWIDKCKVIENLKHCIQFQAVIWRKPEMGWVKFNVDGCCKGNPGTTGGGGMIRNYNGEMIKAFAEFYGQGNNNLAEAKAMLYGVKLCCNCGFSKVIVESDSMLIVNLVNHLGNSLRLLSRLERSQKLETFSLYIFLEKGTQLQTIWPSWEKVPRRFISSTKLFLFL